MRVDHDHPVFVEGCFRCDLSRDEVVDRRPCSGLNSNVCVAEGCYNEACLKVYGD